MTDHLKLFEKLKKMLGGDRNPFETPVGTTQECLSANDVASYMNEGETDKRVTEHLKNCEDCREGVSRFKQSNTF